MLKRPAEQLASGAPGWKRLPNLAIAKKILDDVRAALAELAASGRAQAVDLKQAPRMDEQTYAFLREALGYGEVTARVDAEMQVEVCETQYPGVWWTAYRNGKGEVMTEMIEITLMPKILQPSKDDIEAGLQRWASAAAARETETAASGDQRRDAEGV